MTRMKRSISARISSYSKHNSKKRNRDRKRKYRAKQKKLKIKKQVLVISKLLDHQRELNEKNIIQDIIISDFKKKKNDFKEKEYSFTRYIKTIEMSSNQKKKENMYIVLLNGSKMSSIILIKVAMIKGK